jgi:epoxyqueuosine reductase
MRDGDVWPQVLAALAAAGWRARVVPAARLDELQARVHGVIESGGLPQELAAHLLDETAVELPAELAEASSVVIAALGRSLTQATLVWDGVERTIAVPPHYAGYYVKPREMTAVVAAVLARRGYRALRLAAPLKTLAACAGLASYGRNNITYVAGLGSYHQLAACASDAPPPDESGWSAPQELERCAHCRACVQACPSGAIDADRFLLHTERCLTQHNESLEPFPAWIEPSWHTCAVGCLRCQVACPENAAVTLEVAAPERFDEAETAAILAACDPDRHTEATRAKLARCGLDYSPALIARNLRAALAGAGS